MEILSTGHALGCNGPSRINSTGPSRSVEAGGSGWLMRDTGAECRRRKEGESAKALSENLLRDSRDENERGDLQVGRMGIDTQAVGGAHRWRMSGFEHEETARNERVYC